MRSQMVDPTENETKIQIKSQRFKYIKTEIQFTKQGIPTWWKEQIYSVNSYLLQNKAKELVEKTNKYE